MSGSQWLYSWLCHQLPGRTPHFAEWAFPLCYRCAGLHLGLLAAFVTLALSGAWRRPLEVRRGIQCCLLILPLMVDGWANHLGLWSTPGWLRAATGLAMGIALPPLLVPLVSRGAEPTRERRSSRNDVALLGSTVLGAALLWLLHHPGGLAMFQALSLGALVGTLLFAASLLRAAWLTWTLRRERAG